MNENENRRTRCIVRGLTDRKAGKQENRLPEVAAVLISIGDVLPIIYWSIHAHYFFFIIQTLLWQMRATCLPPGYPPHCVYLSSVRNKTSKIETYGCCWKLFKLSVLRCHKYDFLYTFDNVLICTATGVSALSLVSCLHTETERWHQTMETQQQK